MRRLKRAIRNWLGVNGDSSYPHRIVTMITWHDKIIAVDGNGDVYDINFDWQGQPIIQLAMKNPLGR